MSGYAIELLAMLVLILVAAEVFTNALEHLGERLGISEGATGSVFAAVGTALPETIVPLLAIFAGTAHSAVNEEIGVGAILGAPLMLATLSTFLMGISVLKRRGGDGHLRPEKTGLLRDLDFFLFAFMIAIVAMFIPVEQKFIRGTLSLVLVLSYFFYVLMTFKASTKLVQDGHATESSRRLFLSYLKMPVTMVSISLQLVLGVVLLVLGAKGFIYGVEHVSELLGISALLLSLLIIPVATELPEKVNSILWIRKGKDTLAFGNITGAMVFQGTLLPAIGITLTPWEPRLEILSGVIVTLAAAIWLRSKAMSKEGLRVWMLFVNGALYAAYLFITLT